MSHLNRPGRRKPLPIAVLLAAILLTGCGSQSSGDFSAESSIKEQSQSETTESSAVSEESSAEQKDSTNGTENSRTESSTADVTKPADSSVPEHTTVSAEQTSVSSGTVSTTASSATTVSTAKTTESTKASSAETTLTSEQNHKDPGLGAKWPNRFAKSGSPVITDTSYKSEDVSVDITKMTKNGTVYFIADIYIRYIDCFRSAFSVNRNTGVEEYGAEGGSPYQEDGSKLSKRVNAILTINGDYYSGRKTGVIFRNGTLYRNIPRAEIGAVYLDGTYKGFTKDSFDVTEEQKNGLWQVMGFEPRLVENGKAIQNIRTVLAGMDVAAPRSGFGYYEPGHYCFVVADGRQEGYSVGPELQEWASFFEELGCEAAFNLDGGASSQLYFMGELVNHPSTGTSGGVVRMLPDVFYIGEKTE